MFLKAFYVPDIVPGPDIQQWTKRTKIPACLKELIFSNGEGKGVVNVRSRSKGQVLVLNGRSGLPLLKSTIWVKIEMEKAVDKVHTLEDRVWI